MVIWGDVMAKKGSRSVKKGVKKSAKKSVKKSAKRSVKKPAKKGLLHSIAKRLSLKKSSKKKRTKYVLQEMQIKKFENKVMEAYPQNIQNKINDRLNQLEKMGFKVNTDSSNWIKVQGISQQQANAEVSLLKKKDPAINASYSDMLGGLIIEGPKLGEMKTEGLMKPQAQETKTQTLMLTSENFNQAVNRLGKERISSMEELNVFSDYVDVPPKIKETAENYLAEGKEIVLKKKSTWAAAFKSKGREMEFI